MMKNTAVNRSEDTVEYLEPVIYAGVEDAVVFLYLDPADNCYWPASVDNQEGPPIIPDDEQGEINTNDYMRSVFLETRPGQPYPLPTICILIPYKLPTDKPNYLTVFTVVNGAYVHKKKKRSAVMLSQAFK